MVPDTILCLIIFSISYICESSEPCESCKGCGDCENCDPDEPSKSSEACVCCWLDLIVHVPFWILESVEVVLFTKNIEMALCNSLKNHKIVHLKYI